MTAAALHEDLASLRRRLHGIPELGFEESDTAALICTALSEMQVPFVTGVGGTGVVATLSRGGGSGAIGLRADIDALPIDETTNLPYRSTRPGRMHACGHDGHVAMLLGAVRALRDSTAFDGTIHFIFQPAEEHGKGALAMMDDGLFERFPVDAIYGLHNMPLLEAGTIALRPGPIMAAEDNFAIHVRGQGGHAAMPHRSRDALTIGAAIVTELQTVVARSVDPLEGAVLSCTEFVTDGAVNVIPSNVTIRGDTRSFRPEVSSLIEARMQRIARALCDAHEAGLDFTYDRVFPPTINTASEAALAARAAARTPGVGHVDADCAPMMASEDFGAMVLRRPGCYAFIGNRGKDGKGGTMLHNPGYDFNDDIIPLGVAYWVTLAETALPA